jgi:arabinogalactan endo-1,4-beta-galactosidase
MKHSPALPLPTLALQVLVLGCAALPSCAPKDESSADAALESATSSSAPPAGTPTGSGTDSAVGVGTTSAEAASSPGLTTTLGTVTGQTDMPPTGTPVQAPTSSSTTSSAPPTATDAPSAAGGANGQTPGSAGAPSEDPNTDEPAAEDPSTEDTVSEDPAESEQPSTSSDEPSASGSATAEPGAPLPFSFWIGADISDQEGAEPETREALLTLMKEHGFNAVRLRTFVDPKAADGYDQRNGHNGIAFTVEFGKQVKAAGMALLVDFHYSDNWADPGKQCVPIAWQGYTAISDLAAALHDYTKDSISQLVEGGARPDMVQVGNETTPGMLLHKCDGGGQPTGSNGLTGSTSNWDNLGALLKAGVDGVKEVDDAILVALHIDRGGDKGGGTQGGALSTSLNWIKNAKKYTEFDAFGESSYQSYQGDPNSEANTQTGWEFTFGGIAAEYPELKLFSAEYGPMQRQINDVLFGLDAEQGLGTFNWEPTTEGDWNRGHDLFRRSGGGYTAQPDIAVYDQMLLDYAERL